MNKETLDKAVELDEEICCIREMIGDETLYIWKGVHRQHAEYRNYTTKEIDTKLREMLKSELKRKEKEFEEL